MIESPDDGPVWPVTRHEQVRALRGQVGEGDAELTHAEFTLLTFVAGYTNKDGTNAYPGTSRLAFDVRIKDKSNLKPRLRALVDKGFLVVEREGGTKPGEKATANVYALSLPRHLAPEPPKPGGA